MDADTTRIPISKQKRGYQKVSSALFRHFSLPQNSKTTPSANFKNDKKWDSDELLMPIPSIEAAVNTDGFPSEYTRTMLPSKSQFQPSTLPTTSEERSGLSSAKSAFASSQPLTSHHQPILKRMDTENEPRVSNIDGSNTRKGPTMGLTYPDKIENGLPRLPPDSSDRKTRLNSMTIDNKPSFVRVDNQRRPIERKPVENLSCQLRDALEGLRLSELWRDQNLEAHLRREADLSTALQNAMDRLETVNLERKQEIEIHKKREATLAKQFLDHVEFSGNEKQEANNRYLKLKAKVKLQTDGTMTICKELEATVKRFESLLKIQRQRENKLARQLGEERDRTSNLIMKLEKAEEEHQKQLELAKEAMRLELRQQDENSKKQQELEKLISVPVGVRRVQPWGGLKDDNINILTQSMANQMKTLMDQISKHSQPKKIEYILNDRLFKQFNETKTKFRTMRRGAQEVLLFHGTNHTNINSYSSQSSLLTLVSLKMAFQSVA
jgi:hypothetical protein